MHTINYKETYASGATMPGLPVTAFELKVYDNTSTAIHAVSDDASVVVKTQYVFTDPVTKEETAVDYDTLTMSSANTLYVANYQYKIDHLRVVITATGTAGGTIRITGNVAQ
jgi:hypothetical protein